MRHVSPTRILLALSTLIMLLLSACGQSSLDAEGHFQRGLEFQEQGTLQAAVIEFKTALQKDPAHVEARLQLGIASLDLGDLGTARAELRRAENLGLDTPRVRLAMGRLWLMEGDPETLLANFAPEEFVEHDPASGAEAYLLQGEALRATGRLDEATRSFDRALELSPDLALAPVGLASVHVARNHLDEARASLQTALQMDDRLDSAWSLLGDIARAEGNYEDAEAAYSEAIRHSPAPYLVQLKRALARMARGDLAGVEDDLRVLRRIGPQQPETAYVQGLLHYQEGRYPEAQVAFQESLNRAENYPPSLLFLGASHFAQENWNQARRYLEAFLRVQPNSADAARLLAMAHAREGDLVRAERLLVSVLGQNPDDVLALNLVGSIYMAQGQHEAGLAHLRHLVSVQPEDASARARLGAGLLRADEDAEGLRELGAAAAAAPDDARLQVANVIAMIQNRDFEQALAALETLSEQLPDNPLPHNLMGAAYLGQGDLANAYRALLQALTVAPGDPSASINLAALALRLGDREAPGRMLRESLRLHPGHPSVSMRLAEHEAQAGNPAAVAEVLSTALEYNPDAVDVRLMLAQHALIRGEPDRTLALLQPIRESHKQNPAMTELLARAQLAAGLQAQGISSLRALSRQVDDAAEARFRLGQTFENAGSDADARSEYERALVLQPEHPGAMTALALLDLRQGRFVEAVAMAQRMQREPALAARGYSIEGSAHLSTGDIDRAIDAFEQSYALERSAERAVNLTIALERAGRDDEAIAVLSERVQTNPEEDVVRLRLAGILLTSGDYPAALEEYGVLLRDFPENVVVLNNLAYLYQRVGDPRALDLAERAHALAPENPVVADTLGWVLVEGGEVERGLALLEMARQALPDHAEVRYHFAAALLQAGRTEDGRQELSALLSEHADFSSRAEAEKLMRELD